MPQPPGLYPFQLRSYSVANTSPRVGQGTENFERGEASPGQPASQVGGSGTRTLQLPWTAGLAPWCRWSASQVQCALTGYSAWLGLPAPPDSALCILPSLSLSPSPFLLCFSFSSPPLCPLPSPSSSLSLFLPPSSLSLSCSPSPRF